MDGSQDEGGRSAGLDSPEGFDNPDGLDGPEGLDGREGTDGDGPDRFDLTDEDGDEVEGEDDDGFDGEIDEDEVDDESDDFADDDGDDDDNDSDRAEDDEAAVHASAATSKGGGRGRKTAGGGDGQADADVDDDDELTDEVEASLDVILAERLRGSVTEDEDDYEPDEEDDLPNQLATVIPVRQPNEFLCQSCFLLKPPGQLADRDHQLCRDCA